MAQEVDENHNDKSNCEDMLIDSKHMCSKTPKREKAKDQKHDGAIHAAKPKSGHEKSGRKVKMD
jgi:hypothetical protein